MLRDQLKDALKESMKQKEDVAVSTLRLILAALKDRDIADRSKGNQDGISDDAILSLLQSMIKQRRESIDVYEKAGRQELADKEREEIEVIETFLPKQLSEEEMTKAVKGAITKVKASSLKEMGQVMGELKANYAGQMDFGKASAMVKEMLG